MKTNCHARRIQKVRVILFCLAVVAMAGAGMSLGKALTTHIAQVTAQPSASPRCPKMGLPEAMSTLRH